MYDIIERLKNREIKSLTGIHPNGSIYDHGNGRITDVWKVGNFTGFSFRSDKYNSGYTWPGIESVEKIDEKSYRLCYRNTYDEKAYCIIVLE